MDELYLFSVSFVNMKLNKKAFSVAEAMVTLLITSIALAAAAPIISRNIKNSTTANINIDAQIQHLVNEQLPVGAVILFDGATCPKHWAPLSNKYSGAAGAFIRNTGGTAGNLGVVQVAQLPNIKGSLETTSESGWNGSSFDTAYSTSSGAFSRSTRTSGWRVQGSRYEKNGVKFDFNANRSNSTYVDNGEVRPRNISLLYCRKTELYSKF